jgi:hypothetical protein
MEANTPHSSGGFEHGGKHEGRDSGWIGDSCLGLRCGAGADAAGPRRSAAGSAAGRSSQPGPSLRGHGDSLPHLPGRRSAPAKLRAGSKRTAPRASVRTAFWLQHLRFDDRRGRAARVRRRRKVNRQLLSESLRLFQAEVQRDERRVRRQVLQPRQDTRRFWLRKLPSRLSLHVRQLPRLLRRAMPAGPAAARLSPLVVQSTPTRVGGCSSHPERAGNNLAGAGANSLRMQAAPLCVRE